MNQIEALIAEADFHINGMNAIIGALKQGHPKTDPEIIRTLHYSLIAVKERRMILAEVSHLSIDVSA